ncbi:Ser-Thr-rich glycosyl-phosphatidyl-inositol-anchored membrane family [Kalmanozyma brasiliensis GHG001]|uniref:Uncharacterized protein n=1 Tax=Kalmanozyma brasiliensis (strain GHG001) TaxID=1365824 RepID=V5E9N7_KALBG|nr:Ser-Thr-rich glycosyl-phosphatidyl-inositol-anchored membrane family [Kalmanozyma brasiliensis GHG001]EST07041.1 Ser-Thr-rich glycosyl-phosphatidyl-inositol-anchored membrane family [Kalmanozyma brasiliensis GHG001]
MSTFAPLLRLLTLLFLVNVTLAFDITFPAPTNYWVACGWNNMTWRSQSSDPSIVTIMLTNTNKTLLNDDFEIGNALEGADNAAMVYVPCLPAADGYALLFVNASGYDHKPEKVIYTSNEFGIKPKGSTPDPASGQSSIPNRYQPYLETPGIVLPQKGPSEVTNTTTNANSTDGALPKLDGSADTFKDFHPTQHNAAASSMTVVGDVLFVVVVAAFTALVVTS